MSRDFLQHIPEELRGIWDKPETPNPMATHFNTLTKVEQLKEDIRQKSVLYKNIFGEDMFGFVTADGSLNLDITVVNFRSLVKDIDKEIEQQEILGDIRANAVYPYCSPRSDKDYVSLWCSEKTDQFIISTIKDLQEARIAITDAYGSSESSPVDPVVDAFYPPIIGRGLVKADVQMLPKSCLALNSIEDKYTYVDREQRNLSSGVMQMVRAFSRQRTPQEYFQVDFQPKALFTAIRQIRWNRDL